MLTWKIELFDSKRDFIAFHKLFLKKMLGMYNVLQWLKMTLEMPTCHILLPVQVWTTELLIRLPPKCIYLAAANNGSCAWVPVLALAVIITWGVNQHPM